jgi:hypothetical protein
MRPDRLPRKEERALEARKSIDFEAKANMIRFPFDSFVAKTIQAKIDQKLTSPHLLIGGLAVQQYYLAAAPRTSTWLRSQHAAKHS